MNDGTVTREKEERGFTSVERDDLEVTAAQAKVAMENSLVHAIGVARSAATQMIAMLSLLISRNEIGDGRRPMPLRLGLPRAKESNTTATQFKSGLVV